MREKMIELLTTATHGPLLLLLALMMVEIK
jgi:hypothetical protein